MRFTKMEGLGNDFVVVEEIDPTPDLVRQLCDRRRGIGADGLLVVDPFPTMKYWNADGSPAQMCGNGLRCVARYAVGKGWAAEKEWIPIITPVGERRALVDGDRITVEVGTVTIGGMLSIGERVYHEASIGNPHAVTLVEEPGEIDLANEGPLVSNDPAFPEGTNVEFVTVEAPDRIRLRVWERGVGETPACGSGMVVSAAVALGPSEDPVTVLVPGGRGEVFFEGGLAYLIGPAVQVFEGDWPIVTEGVAAR
ncbi:MAG TPA: diaminopimelate epimerase [Acidimicrobiia bacterium]|nr:diaminopimelate epimerase [Acidimicrobiia bacterium]